MRFKRLQLLIEAHHLMRTTSSSRSVLVIVGGFPGEWEGEHPHDTVRRLGAEGVFFAGWRDHCDLAEMFGCCDVFAAPAVDEPFGLVYLEAMASGIPPIGTASGGPLSFINVDPEQPTGWLTAPDDVRATAHALGEATSDDAMRAERGKAAARFVRDHYSWASSAQAFVTVYEELVAVPAVSRRRQSAVRALRRRSAWRRTGSCSSRHRAGGARSDGGRAPRPTAGCACRRGQSLANRTGTAPRGCMTRSSTSSRPIPPSQPRPSARPTSATPPHRRWPVSSHWQS